MKRRIWIGLALVLALVLVLGASTPAVASGGRGDKDKGAPSGHGQGKGRAYGQFQDVGEDHWAYRDISMMEVKGVFGGYGNGRFGPQDSVSCLQLAILAVRVTGNEDAAMAMTAAEVDAALAGGWLDASDPVPDWPGARECLAYAYENGYLNGFINQERVTFRPSAPATRLEVVVTLIDAMGLSDAAAALSDAPIDAPDAGTVPAWAHGYVALAKDMGLLRGGERGALNLDNHVTRAQMAALLSRANAQCGSDVDDKTIKGRLVAVTTGDAPSITIEVKGKELVDYVGEEEDEAEDETEGEDTDPAQPEAGLGEQNYGENEMVTVTYPVSPEATIFHDGVAATLDQLAVGDRVEVRLDADGAAIFIDAKTPKHENGEGGLEVSGPVVSATYEGEILTSVSILVTSVDADNADENDEGEDENEGDSPATPGEGGSGTGLVIGEEATFPVAADADIKDKGDGAVTLGEGDYVELTVKDGVVVAIHVEVQDGEDKDEDGDQGEADEAEGTITAAFVGSDGGTVTVTVTAIDDETELLGLTVGATVTLPLAGDLEIQGPDGEDITLADLSAGCAIEVSIKNGAVTEIGVVGAGDQGEGDEGEEGETD